VPLNDAEVVSTADPLVAEIMLLLLLAVRLTFRGRRCPCDGL
jgi:hypothetical protein